MTTRLCGKYEVEKHEHPESHENQPSDGNTCDDYKAVVCNEKTFDEFA
ncbi:hypothetical protein [Bacillus cereus]|nr:hypothetical protein [Bacillus cereus]